MRILTLFGMTKLYGIREKCARMWRRFKHGHLRSVPVACPVTRPAALPVAIPVALPVTFALRLRRSEHFDKTGVHCQQDRGVAALALLMKSRTLKSTYIIEVPKSEFAGSQKGV